MDGFILLHLEEIVDGKRIIFFENIKVNSEGQNLFDTSIGNLSEKFTGSGLPAFSEKHVGELAVLRTDGEDDCNIKGAIASIDFASQHVGELAVSRDLHDGRLSSDLVV